MMNFPTRGVRRIGINARRTTCAALALCLAVGAFPAHADLTQVRNTLVERMRANKQPFNPSSVKETLITGLYRWDQGPRTGQIYVNEAVTLMLLTDGNKIVSWEQPVRQPQPISDSEKIEMLSEMIRNIRFDKLIHVRQGKGTNQVLLLSAFDCPVCIRFERMMEAEGSRLDMDLYIVPSTLDPDVTAKVSTVRSIWCAENNAVVWRKTVVQGGWGYFLLPKHSCDVSMSETRDIELLLRSVGGFKGYPYMVLGNGEMATASTDAIVFASQLRKAAGKGFWTDPHPEKYAQFRK
ncbi:MAG TPA: hypothetical protein VJ652_04210 [Noviherbaspirillum sp.]|nr:hypothetical protein [Noviherbaspirillum sp.]